MHSSLTILAGPEAYRLIQERGLRATDVDVIPAASGGAKWLILGGLDVFLFGEFLRSPRSRPLHLIGSSIGSWRMACLAQRDPVAALARGHEAYIYRQRYTARPSPTEVSRVLGEALDFMLGEHGATEILNHPWARLHVLTTSARGMAARSERWPLTLALAMAVARNAFSRRALGRQLQRVVWRAAGDGSPFDALRDLPTTHRLLTPDNLRPVLLASGSIPLLMEGVRIADDPGRTHWDGGVIDYHPSFSFGDGDGLVLFPHFYPHLIPGWFDKSMPWRRVRANSDVLRRVLLIAPSMEFVASLPGGTIPDRQDFYRWSERDRIRRWQAVLDRSEVLGAELRELLVSGRFAEKVRPWRDA